MSNNIFPPGSSKNANEAIRLRARGGNGGRIIFDSGVILAPLLRIRIIVGFREEFKGSRRYSVIKRIYLEFVGGNGPVPALQSDEYERRSDDIPYDLLINQTAVTRADVWTDGNLINAVQFHASSGQISPRFGEPRGGYLDPFIFQSHGQIVGIHGSCGAAMNSLGFTFQSLPFDVWGLRVAQFMCQSISRQLRTEAVAHEVTRAQQVFDDGVQQAVVLPDGDEVMTRDEQVVDVTVQQVDAVEVLPSGDEVVARAEQVLDDTTQPAEVVEVLPDDKDEVMSDDEDENSD